MAIALTLILLCTMALANNARAQGLTIQGWQIEAGGGSCSQSSDGTIRLWSNGDAGYNSWLALYKQIAPQTDFNFSLQVNAAILGAWGSFAIALTSSLPIGGSLKEVNFEFGHEDQGSFLLAWGSNNSWSWNEFTGGAQNVWYTMQLSVQANPFVVTATVLDQNGTSLGSYSASDTTLTLGNITYIGLEVWGYGTSRLFRQKHPRPIRQSNIHLNLNQFPIHKRGLGSEHHWHTQRLEWHLTAEPNSGFIVHFPRTKRLDSDQL